MTPHINSFHTHSTRNDSKSTLGQTARNGSTAPQDVSAKPIIVMVGLPARGKSYIVKKLARYLNWLQFTTRIFNAGQRRRVAAIAQNGPPSDVSSAAFFDPSNPDRVALRDRIALDTLDELLEWLTSDDEASVGIFDATNTTVERRRLVISHIRMHSSPPPDILFLESYSSAQIGAVEIEMSPSHLVTGCYHNFKT
jgi:6-phosphofructo-2-kinase